MTDAEADSGFVVSMTSEQWDDDIAEVVREICMCYQNGCLRYTGEVLPTEQQVDRRSVEREEASLPFYVVPLVESSTGLRRSGETPIIAVTRDFSGRGIGLRCDVPLPTNQILAEFDCDCRGSVRLLVEIYWQTRQSAHCYLAGGRIIRLVESDEFTKSL